MVKVLVLSGDGLNCEIETSKAFELAGAHSSIIHVNKLFEEPDMINNFDIFAIPGGFSFGDEINSGQIMAKKIETCLGKRLHAFIEDRKLIIGICNGFQILTKLKLLPSSNIGVSLTENKSRRFINKWVEINSSESHCIWTKNLPKSFFFPIRHKEGNVQFSIDSVEDLKSQGYFPLSYTEDVNGSTEKIAGITDKTGRVLGLMPHPEAATNELLNPFKSMNNKDDTGLIIFKNAVNYIQGVRNE